MEKLYLNQIFGKEGVEVDKVTETIKHGKCTLEIEFSWYNSSGLCSRDVMEAIKNTLCPEFINLD